MLAAPRATVENRPNHQQRKQPQRQVDVENPAPGCMLNDKPADQRAYHRRQAKHAAKQPLIATPIGRRDHVRHGGHADHHQAAAPQPLQGAHQHQLGHVLRQATQRRAHQEKHYCDLQDDFTAKQIAEFAIQRHHDGRTEDIGCHHPGELIQPAQLTDDGRQRGGDNGLIQRREQHHQQERAEQQLNRRRLFRRLSHYVGLHKTSLEIN